jgi:hypothetical protein
MNCVTSAVQGSALDVAVSFIADFCTDFEGTAAQLTAEGLLPGDFEWPAGDRRACWTANGVDYEVFRTRPNGHKGPKRSWLTLDNWCLRIKVADPTGSRRLQRVIERKARELEDEIFRQSAQGARDCDVRFSRYVNACQDGAFQAFKTALLPPRRVVDRRCKSVDAEGGAA